MPKVKVEKKSRVHDQVYKQEQHTTENSDEVDDAESTTTESNIPLQGNSVGAMTSTGRCDLDDGDLAGISPGELSLKIQCPITIKKEESDDQQPPVERLVGSQVPELSQEDQHYIFPKECCICQSVHWHRERLSGKRKRESLVACQTLTASNSLEQAAEMTGNQALLLRIQGKDLVASEAHYHASCYRAATRILSKQTKEEGNPDEVHYHNSYKVFCRDIIDKRLIENKEIFRMTTLREMFVKYIRDVQGLDASSYRAYNLKKRLQNSYPQLQFLQPIRKRESQLVMVRGEFRMGRKIF